MGELLGVAHLRAATRRRGTLKPCPGAVAGSSSAWLWPRSCDPVGPCSGPRDRHHTRRRAVRADGDLRRRSRDRCGRARGQARGGRRPTPPVRAIRSPPQTRRARDRRLFRQRRAVTFDVSSVRPETCVCGGSRLRTICCPCSHDHPPDRRGAGRRHAFTWRYGWTFASYALSVRETQVLRRRHPVAGRRPDEPAGRLGAGRAASDRLTPRGATWSWASRTSCRTDSITCCSSSASIC